MWQDIFETDAQILDRAIHMIEDWSDAKVHISTQAHTTTTRSSVASTSHQTPPHVFFFLIEHVPHVADLSATSMPFFSDSLNRIGIRICIRDDEGTFVLAKTVSLSRRCHVPLGEALGLFHDIQWLRDMQFDNVDFALDSQLTTKVFNHQREDVSEFGKVIFACKRLFTSSFTNSQVEFNKRQSNVVTHTFAWIATLSASFIPFYL